ncbi:integral membrane sensor signal transduction histidine kinase precursor [Bradyrhizobium oligotrophicum S58]|uniref:Integral membrane sensor signal transduction histidine kinase n=1 Tax=Bradyrhizobium oligotrophicum S58 TaxID=1245469 RepID=M4Z3M3_9BRAD|nr:histidine kinase [Bradyrhizobium oligotrophicum]BAM87461.1 integral membrane sensor signal transduction histidine kinase precursor [Bradyrhizobium oligotrophicum S58]
MHLLLHLIGRLFAVVAVCLSTAVAWVMIDAHHAIDADAAATAERVGQRLESLYWQKLLWRDGMSREMLLPISDWQTLTIASVVSPGNCVTFDSPGEAPRQLCSQIEALGPPAPKLFAAAFDVLFGPPTPVRRHLTVRDWNAGFIVAAAAPEAALRLAWRQVSVVTGVAAAMAAAIAVFAAMMIGHALIPARAIIDGLRRLQQGDLGCRLPGFRTAEFNLIARAVNELSAALARTNAARTALTARLFQVQEEERRSLARDLHDEFGQCLTATAALAASIEAGASPGRADLADDARAIARIQHQMMENLRSALVRLRSQDVEEIGLEASLRQLVGDHNMRAAGAVFRLNVIGELAALPKQLAIDVYRIAQEGLTNAVRHGSPTEVALSVACDGGGDGTIALTVEDDGGGDTVSVDPRHGHGILGIRERVAARGGSVSIGKAARGLRLSAVMPLMTPAPAQALYGAGP